jgi:hypothetical protein
VKVQDHANFLGVHSIFMLVNLYTEEKLVQLNNNLTSSVNIDSRLQQAKKLQQWVDKQPDSSLFS